MLELRSLKKSKTLVDLEFLYHMTHISNLKNILQHGLMSHNNPHKIKDISDCEVNSRRSRKDPIYNKSIHSYVPFYFNPKNAMLFRRQEIQRDIVILCFKKQLFLRKGTIFTDGNASNDCTKFYNNLNDFDKLDWDCLNDSRWSHHPDGKRTRMAEILISDTVDITYLSSIICYDMKTKIKTGTMTDFNCKADIDGKFYF